MQYTVYLLTNVINGKQYVGQTCQEWRLRWNQHCSGKPYCRVLHRAIIKYGKNAFRHEVLATALSKNESDRLERGFIETLNTRSPYGYNLRDGGAWGRHSIETRLMISRNQKGRKNTGRAAKGVPRPPVPAWVGRHISAAKKGRPNGLLGTKRPYIPHVASRKHIVGIDQVTGEQHHFDSVTEASTSTGASAGNIVAAAKGRRRYAGRYIWNYIKEPSDAFSVSAESAQKQECIKQP